MKRSSGVLGFLGVSALVLAGCGSISSASAPPSSKPPVTVPTKTTVLPPAGVFPLTGLPATAAQASIPALEVKIDNAPGVAWPQSGINQADVVYEEVVEGGITRYMAIYQSRSAPVVGPVRSVRYTDALIVAPIGGLFAYSGGIPAFVSALHATGVYDVGANVAGNDYYRINSRPMPHNLYTSTIVLRKFAGSEGSAPPHLFDYYASGGLTQANSSANPQPIASASISMSVAENALWTWNPGAQLFYRTTDGTPQIDASGRPVTTNNVIVEDVSYPYTIYTDPAGNPVPYANIIGSGTAFFLVGGKEFQGTWSKPSESALTTYTTSSGSPLLLSPGRTWVMLAPIGTVPAATP